MWTCIDNEWMGDAPGEAGQAQGLPAWSEGTGTALPQTLWDRKAHTLGMSAVSLVG